METITKSKYGCLWIIIVFIVVFIGYWFGFRKPVSAPTATTQTPAKQEQPAAAAVPQAKTCVIPNKLKLSDFIGLPMKDLADKYGGEFKLYPNGFASNIVCENDAYKVNIMATKKDHLADYVLMEFKELGYCEAGINNVKAWADKSITAAGYNPATKGTPRINTENNMSQLNYDDYNTGDKNIILIVECNITGNYITVGAVMLRK
ncbi:MAG: hypothetical protein WCJ29_05790 [bacterium]